MLILPRHIVPEKYTEIPCFHERCQQESTALEITIRIKMGMFVPCTCLLHNINKSGRLVESLEEEGWQNSIEAFAVTCKPPCLRLNVEPATNCHLGVAQACQGINVCARPSGGH